jgi:3-phenylpropionate/trans-cinnamate dioxygenase ferredoxin component
VSDVRSRTTPHDLPVAEAGRSWRWAADAKEIGADEAKVLGTLPPVSVFHSEGQFFGLDDTCTHETYSLAEGWVEDGAVECTLHLATFDLRTGEPTGPPAYAPVRTHPVHVLDDQIYIALPDDYLVKG